ncbi:hyphally regulated cell wall protein 3-like [Anoplophora glabripennis]|uniref:hyphally regulated cell wall protein 3-like n=1 Tax=Anoplophora glabripennis TaxID=217634 RepID=UPI0008753345|nr:hyphally regulated cell wall protein 3-like [Anoplophora glabripennis]
MKYFVVCALLVIYISATCFRPVASQSSDASGGGYGSANNEGSSHNSGTNENNASGTIRGLGRVLGSLGMSSRSSGESGTNLSNNAQGGGSATAHTG